MFADFGSENFSDGAGWGVEREARWGGHADGGGSGMWGATVRRSAFGVEDEMPSPFGSNGVEDEMPSPFGSNVGTVEGAGFGSGGEQAAGDGDSSDDDGVGEHEDDVVPFSFDRHWNHGMAAWEASWAAVESRQRKVAAAATTWAASASTASASS